MNEIKITNGDRYFCLFIRETDNTLFINTEDGEGTELNQEEFYDHLKKYFDEHM